MWCHLQRILITGAASGIGAGLAKRYAKPGVTLCLTDRNGELLKETVQACKALGAAVTAEALDITDRGATTAWVERMDDAAPLDLVSLSLTVGNCEPVCMHSLGINQAQAGACLGSCACRRTQALLRLLLYSNTLMCAHVQVFGCAGIAACTSGVPEAERKADQLIEVSYRIFNVNVYGVLNTILPAVQRMKGRRAGQIVIVASLAGFNPNSLDYAYSASKAAVLNYGQSLRSDVHALGVRVNTVCPAFIETPLTSAFNGPKPLQVQLDYALDQIITGIEQDDAVVVFPPPMHMVAGLYASLPWVIRDAIAALGVSALGAYTKAPAVKKTA